MKGNLFMEHIKPEKKDIETPERPVVFLDSFSLFLTRTLGIKICPYNPNPKVLCTDDCAIRAFTKCLNKSWNEVYEGLVEVSKRYPGQLFNMTKPMDRYAKDNHMVVIYKSYFKLCPMTVGEFLYRHKCGRFIINIEEHSFCYMNGIVYDSKGLYESDLYLTETIESVYCESYESIQSERLKSVLRKKGKIQ